MFNTPSTLSFWMPATSTSLNLALGSAGSFVTPPAGGDVGNGTAANANPGTGAPVNQTPVIGAQSFGTPAFSTMAVDPNATAHGDSRSDAATNGNTNTVTPAAGRTADLTGDLAKPVEAPVAVCLPVSVDDFVEHITSKGLDSRFERDPIFGPLHDVIAVANGLRSASGTMGQKVVARVLKTIPSLEVIEDAKIPISRAAFEKVDDSGQLLPRAASDIDGRRDQRASLDVDLLIHDRRTSNIYLIEVRLKSRSIGYKSEKQNFSRRFVAAANCVKAHCEAEYGWPVKDVYFKVLDLKSRGGRSPLLMGLGELDTFLHIEGSRATVKAGLSRIETAIHDRLHKFTRDFLAEYGERLNLLPEPRSETRPDNGQSVCATAQAPIPTRTAASNADVPALSPWRTL